MVSKAVLYDLSVSAGSCAPKGQLPYSPGQRPGFVFKNSLSPEGASLKGPFFPVVMFQRRRSNAQADAISCTPINLMRKRIIGEIETENFQPNTSWLDLSSIAQVEVTSEETMHPIEDAL